MSIYSRITKEKIARSLIPPLHRTELCLKEKFEKVFDMVYFKDDPEKKVVKDRHNIFVVSNITKRAELAAQLVYWCMLFDGDMPIYVEYPENKNLIFDSDFERSYTVSNYWGSVSIMVSSILTNQDVLDLCNILYSRRQNLLFTAAFVDPKFMDQLILTMPNMYDYIKDNYIVNTFNIKGDKK